MSATLDIILPVFLVIGFGYLAVWRQWFTDAGVDGLMTFTQNFAIPCLLFRAISTLDLAQEFDAAMLASFYLGALGGFLTGLFGARLFFGRSWDDCVAIGFCALFSNSLMLGLPITERAYGVEALQSNYAIIAMHAPFCYIIGISVMEMVKARGVAPASLPGKVLRAVLGNGLVIGIMLGLAVNLSGLALPVVVADAVDLMVRAAIPAALFGLGGVLYRYRPEGDLRTIMFVTACSLVVHPGIAWGLATALGVGTDGLRSATITAAMAPGVNAYLFANMYGNARRVAASTVLMGTGLSIFSVWFWLAVLP